MNSKISLFMVYLLSIRNEVFMKKHVLIILIILSVCFINVKVVNAEEYAYCYYNFTFSF